ncbi:hypothetical protein LCGC14_1921480 [marine sediment metagenome]|uniref:Uncharacterized protein n=1 Tax=marine sediment metagenome TaxID=412755 RepID=A0A0F9I4N9_9ZZZZ
MGESELEFQLAERDKGIRWIRQKLKLPDGVGMDDVYGEMNVQTMHAHGYMAYIEAGKCDDKSGKIARLSTQLSTAEAERDAAEKARSILGYMRGDESAGDEYARIERDLAELTTLRARVEEQDKQLAIQRGWLRDKTAEIKRLRNNRVAVREQALKAIRGDTNPRTRHGRTIVRTVPLDPDDHGFTWYCLDCKRINQAKTTPMNVECYRCHRKYRLEPTPET